MPQKRYSPESIQGVVAEMVFRARTTWSLRRVHAYWDGHGWNVNANSVDDPNRWHAGNIVVSRNCYFLPFIWREFYFATPFSSHRAFYRLRLTAAIA